MSKNTKEKTIIGPIGSWIERVHELAHRYKSTYRTVDVPEMRRLLDEKKEEEQRTGSFIKGLVTNKIRLLETKMAETEDSAKALEEYATMLERLIECRNHTIPHRHDTEIIDYILTGEKNEQ